MKKDIKITITSFIACLCMLGITIEIQNLRADNIYIPIKTIESKSETVFQSQQESNINSRLDLERKQQEEKLKLDIHKAELKKKEEIEIQAAAIKAKEIELSNQIKLPLNSYEITSEYGYRCDVEGVYNGCLLHNGLDFGVFGDSNTPALSIAKGIVTGVFHYDGLYAQCGGNYVSVYHPDLDMTTMYLHMSSTSVIVGQSVLPSTALGIVGTEGCSNGIHLHFMMFQGNNIDSEAVNPRVWFESRGIWP